MKGSLSVMAAALSTVGVLITATISAEMPNNTKNVASAQQSSQHEVQSLASFSEKHFDENVFYEPRMKEQGQPVFASKSQKSTDHKEVKNEAEPSGQQHHKSVNKSAKVVPVEQQSEQNDTNKNQNNQQQQETNNTEEQANNNQDTSSENKQQQEQQQQNDNVAKVIQVKSTAYTANCPGCSGITATGINLLAHPNKKVIAVDPDVIPLGSKVWVEGYGMAVAGDTGGAINGHKIDVFIPSMDRALQWGVRHNVTVKVFE